MYEQVVNELNKLYSGKTFIYESKITGCLTEGTVEKVWHRTENLIDPEWLNKTKASERQRAYINNKFKYPNSFVIGTKPTILVQSTNGNLYYFDEIYLKK
jgi:hypothetical protein